MTNETSPYPLPPDSAAPSPGHAGNERVPDTGLRTSKIGNMVGVGVCALALGLLIWAKLQLVAGVPRTAVAEPDPGSPAVQDNAGTASGPTPADR